jgi:hypothetical protein
VSIIVSIIVIHEHYTNTILTPVCTQEDEKIALSRRVDKHWRLIGTCVCVYVCVCVCMCVCVCVYVCVYVCIGGWTSTGA